MPKTEKKPRVYVDEWVPLGRPVLKLTRLERAYARKYLRLKRVPWVRHFTFLPYLIVGNQYFCLGSLEGVNKREATFVAECCARALATIARDSNHEG